MSQGKPSMGLSFEQIKAAYEREAAAAAKVYTKEEFPMAWDLITPEWLTDILIKAGSAARVTSYHLDQQDEGTARRRRIFLDYNDAGRAAGLPAAVFGKSTQHLENRFIIGMNDGILAVEHLGRLFRHHRQGGWFRTGLSARFRRSARRDPARLVRPAGEDLAGHGRRHRAAQQTATHAGALRRASKELVCRGTGSHGSDRLAVFV